MAIVTHWKKHTCGNILAKYV